MKYPYKLKYPIIYKVIDDSSLIVKKYRGSKNTTYYFLQESDILLFKLKYDNNLEKFNFDPALINLVRKTLPNIIANEICSVQCMINSNET
jgi:hypothetical protein